MFFLSQAAATDWEEIQKYCNGENVRGEKDEAQDRQVGLSRIRVHQGYLMFIRA